MSAEKDEEEKRLAVLEQYAVLDTEDEKNFDDLTLLASYICQTPIALISLIDRDRQWFKSKVGLDVSETPREVAFCHETIKQNDVFVVADTLEDARFAENPLVTSNPSIRFYAGAPITTAEGYSLGSLCVIDIVPREISDEQKSALESLARQVMSLLENRRAKEERARLQQIFDIESEKILEKEKAARKLAEEASRLKDDFLATVSHELRTPLNAILGWAKMLGSGKLDAEVTNRAVETIIRSARSQAQLIEDLLDISRIISGKVRLDVRSVELPPLIESVVESTALAAEARDIEVKTFIDPRAAAISGDSERLQQIFWNLLTNAIKFTPKGGKVQVRLERITSHLEFTVSDNGQGIEPEFLPHVFERFRQSDGSSSRSSGGLGLGLAIVKHLVELHGGSIIAKSEGIGKGAVFNVILPLRIANSFADEKLDQTHPAASIDTPLEILPALKGIKIVVVDDEEDSRLLLKEILAQSGAEVTMCASVVETLEAIRAVKPHILISDIGMPEEDGYSLIRKVRKMDIERIPAIALTAYTRTEDRVKALKSGFQMFIPKPLEPAELIAAVGSLAKMSKRFL